MKDFKFNKMESIWILKITSYCILSERDKDLIVEFVDHVCHKAKGEYGFILHDVLEGKKFSKVVIEGSKFAVINLLSVLRNNLCYKISYMTLADI